MVCVRSARGGGGEAAAAECAYAANEGGGGQVKSIINVCVYSKGRGCSSSISCVHTQEVGGWLWSVGLHARAGRRGGEAGSSTSGMQAYSLNKPCCWSAASAGRQRAAQPPGGDCNYKQGYLAEIDYCWMLTSIGCGVQSEWFMFCCMSCFSSRGCQPLPELLGSAATG